MISQTTEYALRAMVVLASQTDAAMTAGTISSRSRLPFGYLVKVLGSLCRHGLIVARRGRGGGFVLARPATAISMFDVILAATPLRSQRHVADLKEEVSPLAHHLCLGHELSQDHWRSIPLACLVEPSSAPIPALR